MDLTHEYCLPDLLHSCLSRSDGDCSVAAEDSDAPKTVEERLQHRSKVTLMRQFSWAAAVCVTCYVVALVLPLFYFSQPGDEDTAVLVVLILWNCVRWLFLAGLCFIFRQGVKCHPLLGVD